MLHYAWELLKQTVSEWMEDKVARLGAALAFYSVLSIAPLLVIITALAGAFFGREAASGEIVAQIEDLVGHAGAQAIQAMIANANELETGTWAALIGLITLLFGASCVFAELQDALNTIWEVQPKSGRVLWTIIKDRFLSFAMVLGTGFLLLVSLAISAALNAMGTWLREGVAHSHFFIQIVEKGVSFAVFGGLFALIFKVVPDVRVPWRSALLGAAVTAILFTIGKYCLGAYLGRASFMSAYGAAGSFVVLIVWIYYSAQILYFGAELSQVDARLRDQPVPTQANAQPLTEKARVHQGIPHRAVS